MRTLKGLCTFALLAFSSAFFIGTSFLPIEKVEAYACSGYKPGNYSNHGADGLSAGNSCGGKFNPLDTVGKGVAKTVEDLYNPIAGVVVGMSILVIIYSAYLLVTSSGDPRRIALGKKMLLGAGIGIIVILSSFTIMNLMMSIVGI